MQYIYGPVQSRRLGLSLGLSLTPHKACNFDCVYCQLGKTAERSLERRGFVDASAVATELAQWLSANPEQAKQLRFITVSGQGEPTLSTELGNLVASIKKMTTIPVAVITNGSLLTEPLVRKELMGADLIVPSLDAVTQELFQRIDRPAPEMKLKEIIEGLINLRQEFQGKLWLEVMLVKGYNDSLSHIRKLTEVIKAINPDKVQLNSPVRCTTEKDIQPLNAKQLEKIKEIIGEKCEII